MADLPPPPDPAAPSAGPASGAPRWMRWLLVASLALNLLVIGLVAGAAVKHGRGTMGPRPGDFALGPYASAFAPEDKAAILRELRGRPDLAAFEPGGRARTVAAVAAALRAEPFDRDALDRAIDLQLSQFREAEGVVREAVMDRIASMEPAERAAFADRLEAAVRTGPGGPEGPTRP